MSACSISKRTRWRSFSRPVFTAMATKCSARSTSGGGLLVEGLARLGQRLLQKGIVCRQESHRYSLDEDAFALFGVTSPPQVLVQRRRVGQKNEDVQVERQHWLGVEGGAHGAADGVAADDAIALECIHNLQRFFHMTGSVYHTAG